MHTEQRSTIARSRPRPHRHSTVSAPRHSPVSAPRLSRMPGELIGGDFAVLTVPLLTIAVVSVLALFIGAPPQ